MQKLGAEYIAADVVRFRLWATGQQKVMLRLAGKDQEMQASGDGWFTLDVSGVTPGTEYNFVLSDGMVVPDPASRAQKTDVNGPSYVVDPGSYTWRNTGWKGSRWEQAVVYEMHTGTFTPEGTFRAAIAKLPYLAELGVTVIEVMPVAQFGGERGWAMTAYCFTRRILPMGRRMISKRLLTPRMGMVFPSSWILC
ncbi:hydrolase [Salmonella enterica subsp. enterica serovar Sanjuan]|uniref:Hydrolase n=1 Tax=Salmonella enterica subsp. enterica serovar Sanjuan TaxID=1160765 RepID=A0A447NU44_SALET|nr:hydrolase [Salmonella enterica subsp. enterica serovar Sanjuan]